MKLSNLKNLLIALMLISFSFNLTKSQEASKKVDENIQISKKNRDVKILGTFNISKGILEFIAASDKTPRDYESLILLDAKPLQIQNALIEIGLTPYLDKKENGSNLEISVTWNYNNKQFTHNIIEFIELNHKEKTIKDLQWIFSGGNQLKEAKEPAIAEDKNGEIIALQPGIAGIIHPSIDFGNPYDENKQMGFRINEKHIKELIASGQLPNTEKLKQTKLTLIIKPKESKK